MDLSKQILGFMSEISDEFKAIIIDAICSLCLKFPTKHIFMLRFFCPVSCATREAMISSGHR